MSVTGERSTFSPVVDSPSGRFPVAGLGAVPVAQSPFVVTLGAPQARVNGQATDVTEGLIMTQNSRPGLLGVEDLAARLGVSSRYVRRLVAERRIAYLKIGHLLRFEPDVVDRWIEGNRIGPLRPGKDPPAHDREIRRPRVRNAVGLSQERQTEDVA